MKTKSTIFHRKLMMKTASLNSIIDYYLCVFHEQ